MTTPEPLPSAIDAFLDEPPAESSSLAATRLALLQALQAHHRTHCEAYRRILEGCGGGEPTSLEELTYLPARLFKHTELASVPEEAIHRRLYSSGTSGQASSVVLDAATAARQSKALVRSLQPLLGKERRPMLVIDSPETVPGDADFSARAAGIQGFLQFGRKPVYALDSSLKLNREAIETFFQEHGSERVLIFGFTWIVWKQLLEAMEESGLKLPFKQAILIHGGGWKQLGKERVSPSAFRERLQGVLGRLRVINYYGFVEQVGTLYLEDEKASSKCEYAVFRTPPAAALLVRDPVTLECLPQGEVGLLQLLSLVPTSYPGQAILTEDLGRCVGVDEVSGAQLFEVHGRLPRSERRGCSDTLEPLSAADEECQVLAAGDADGDGLAKPFATDRIQRLEALGQKIREKARAGVEPELATLGFWLRGSHLGRLEGLFHLRHARDAQSLPAARGGVLHVAPANVDTLFCYSWALSYLCGNANAVRLSSRTVARQAWLLETLTEVLEGEAGQCFFTGPHGDPQLAEASAGCDLRVIWGGDASVEAVRGLPLGPRATELTFPDRTSLALIDAKAYASAEADEQQRLRERFLAELMAFGQQACTSPHLLLWLGDRASLEAFAKELQVAAAKREQTGIERQDRLVSSYLQLSQTGGHLSEGSGLSLRLLEEPLDLQACRGQAGTLTALPIASLKDVPARLSSRTQTLSYYGLEDGARRELAEVCARKGLDRLVPIGQAHAFDIYWDGHDLFGAFTRRIALA